MTFARALTLALFALPAAALAADGGTDLSELKVKLDKQPLSLKGGVVYGLGSAARYLELSTEPLRCEDYAATGRLLTESERYLTVRFAPLLQPDGQSIWTTTSLTLNTLHGPDGDVALDGLKLGSPDLDKPAPFSLNQDLELPEVEFFKLKARKLSLSGQGKAQSCGQRPGLLPVTSRPQEKLQLSVAGKVFPVMGATFGKSGESRRLKLSTSPLSCDGSNAEDVRVEIDLDKSESGSLFIYAIGDVLPMQFNTTTPALGAAPGADAAAGLFSSVVAAEPGAPLQVQIQGAFALGDLPVKISGEVSALDCTQAAP